MSGLSSRPLKGRGHPKIKTDCYIIIYWTPCRLKVRSVVHTTFFGASQQNSIAAISLKTRDRDLNVKTETEKWTVMAPRSLAGVIQISRSLNIPNSPLFSQNLYRWLKMLACTLSEVAAQAWPHIKGVSVSFQISLGSQGFWRLLLLQVSWNHFVIFLDGFLRS